MITFLCLLVCSSAWGVRPDGHLKFFNDKVHAHLFWEKDPKTSDEAILRLEWRDAKTHKLISPSFMFEAGLTMNMSGHSHGSEPPDIRQAMDKQGQRIDGVYTISNLRFYMKGEWDFEVSVNDKELGIESQTWTVCVDSDCSGANGMHHH